MLEIGKLYRCLEFRLVVYPTISMAQAADRRATKNIGKNATYQSIDREGDFPAEHSKFWSEKLNCKVQYSEPGEVFMVLEQNEEFVHILFGEKQGWIINKNRVVVEEAN